MNLTDAVLQNGPSQLSSPPPVPNQSYGASKSTGLLDAVRSTALAPAPEAAPSPYFQGKTPTGSFIGISDKTDPFSGRPYLAYRTPGADATTTDVTRTAPLTNPEVATTTPRSAFENPRMPEAASQSIRASLGATPAQQLDHQLALAVGGSNNAANLKLIPTADNQAAAPLEGQLASDISSGSKSLFQAQNEEAKAKGLPTPWTDQQVQQGSSFIGTAKNLLGTAWGAVKDFTGMVLDHAVSAVEHPLQTGQGVVQTGVLKPLAFFEGITNGFLTNVEAPVLSKITGIDISKLPTAQPVNTAKVLADANASIQRTPQDQQAFDTGNFLGWILPYSKVSEVTQIGLDSLKLAPTVAKYIPAISDAAGFLGTGQILHDPQDGSRVDQLRNDAIALALFKVGGFALGKAGLYAARGLAKILPDSTASRVNEAMQPVYDAFQKKQPVAVDTLQTAVDNAKQAVVEDTGMTPKEVLQQHFANPEEPIVAPAPRNIPAISAPESVDSFVQSHKLDPASVMATDNANGIVESTGGNDAILTDVPLSKFGNPKFTTLNEFNPKPGRAIKDPIEATLLADGKYRITDGANRFTQALKNGDKTIPVILEVQKGGKALGAADLIKWREETLNPKAPAEMSPAEAASYEQMANEAKSSKSAKPALPSDIVAAREEQFANIHGVSVKDLHTTYTAEDLANARTQVQIGEDTLSNHPGKPLMKYVSHQTGNLPEMSKFTVNGNISKSKFAREGDTLLQDVIGQAESMNGDVSHAADLVDNYKELKAQVDAAKKNYAKIRDTIRLQRQAAAFVSAAPKEIKLPELPAKNGPVLGVAFPGANYLATFINKDIIEKFGLVRDNIKAVYQAGKELLAGPAPMKEKAESITAATIQKLDQAKSAAWAVAEERRDWWAKQTSEVHLDFLDRVERGAISPAEFEATGISHESAKVYAALAADFRDRLDSAFKYETQAGVREGYITDYLPHYWTEPDRAKVFFESYTKSLGKGRFTKMRTIDFIKQGLDAGFELQTTNPEELVLLREIDGQRITTKIDMMHALHDEGLAIPAYGNSMPKGFSAYDSPNGARYFVPPDVAQVLNNAFFEKNLYSMKGVLPTLFRSLMTLKGTFVPIKLSLSLFHPIHITFIASSSERSIVWENIIKGNMGGKEALATLAKATTLASQLEAGKEYGFGSGILKGLWQADVVRWWKTPMDQLTDAQRTVVQYIIDGGGSPAMSEEYLVRARDGFKKALADENYIGATIRGIPKLVESYQKPVFESYIPALKIASYMHGVEQLLKANPGLATDTVARQVAFRKLWQSMDNRFGQMVYGTLFWNPIVKQVMEASFLSLGWNLGFVREFGGGAVDLAKLTAKLTVGKVAQKVAGLPLGAIARGAGKVAEGIGQATKDDITQKMLFMIDYNIQAAMVGGLMTYAMTGKMPATVQDLFFPNTGQTNPDGSPARLNTSFYTREYFTLLNHLRKEGAVGGSIALVQNKMNPVLSSLAEIYNNRDYYGYNIRDTTSPVATQAAQLFNFVVAQGLSPISLAGAETASKTTGTLGQVASIAGFNPAPKYITETPIQTDIYSTLDQRTGGTKPLDSKAQSDAKSNIRTLYLQGKIPEANAALTQAVKDGYISQSGTTQFIHSLDLPADIRAFESLAQFPTDQMHLLASMSEDELKRYAPYASSKVKAIISTLSPAAKQFVDDLNSGKIKLPTFKAGQAEPQ